MDQIKREYLVTKEILKTIDPMIRRLVVKLNLLSFVKQTHFSCSGDFEFGKVHGSPYIIIEYYPDDKFTDAINHFHNEILKDKHIIEFRQEHHFKSMFKLLSPKKLKKVHYSFHIFNMKSFEDFNVYLQKAIVHAYGFKPKLVPWPSDIDRKTAIKTWQHFYILTEKYLTSYSK